MLGLVDDGICCVLPAFYGPTSHRRSVDCDVRAQYVGEAICICIHFAMRNGKQGWKGGPPPARRHSTRVTRPPARLVEATLDSSDSDVDTDVLRATNSDLQRRIQALEAQLSEVDRSGQPSVEPLTSALTALPLLDMATASSTPGPAPQPGTSSTASQDTDYEALLAGALQHLSGATPLFYSWGRRSTLRLRP